MRKRDVFKNPYLQPNPRNNQFKHGVCYYSVSCGSYTNTYIDICNTQNSPTIPAFK